MFSHTNIKSSPFFMSHFKMKWILSKVLCKTGSKKKRKMKSKKIMSEHDISLLLAAVPTCFYILFVPFIPQTFIEYILQMWYGAKEVAYIPK